MKYIICFILVTIFILYCHKSKENFDSIFDVSTQDNKNKPSVQLRNFYGIPPHGGTYLTIPKKNCYAKENELVCDETLIEANSIKNVVGTPDILGNIDTPKSRTIINIAELGTIKNNFIVKYCSIHNFLINAGTSIKINSDNFKKNYLKFNGIQYNLISLEWRKSNIVDYKLQLHLIHTDINNNKLHIVIPLKSNKDTNLIDPVGINNIIHHYDYIPDLNYDSGNIGKFIDINLKELIPIFNIAAFRYIKMNDKEEWFITKNQLFDMLTCDKIYNKIIRMNE